MSTVKYIREQVLKLSQAAFAEIAEVSQPTVSRWEEPGNKESEPNREQMNLIRTEAIRRGVAWNDSWFFETPSEQEATS